MMKRIILLIAVFFLIGGMAYAETMYVTDSFEVTIRTGKDITHKIIALAKSNQKLEVVEQEDEWAFVRLQNGKEGWMLNRFLTKDMPKSVQIEDLKRQNENLVRTVSLYKGENEALKKENREQAAGLRKQENTSRKIEEEYNTLKQESADFLKLKESYEKASEELAVQTKRVEALESELGSLRWNKGLRWFLSGAAILLAGILIGVSFRRQRKSSLLE
ncbi:MAG: TIGR04211 family SH3 domain-containing protein [Pseudomonadota bacterium]